MSSRASGDSSVSPYVTFTRAHWATLRASTPLSLSEADLQELRGLNEAVSLNEVIEIYLPLARLLDLYVAAIHGLHRATETFLGNPSPKVPFVLGIAGSVAVGKSTTARILQALLRQLPNRPRVDLVTTDGFLFPNKVLEERGIMHRKGFPESYDVRRLVRFVADVKSGRSSITAPVYSHLQYDIVPDEFQVVEHPDILLIEGLNVLQSGGTSSGTSRVFVSDFFDFSIYVDADEPHLRQWYIERFLRLRETAFQDPTSFFRDYARLDVDEAQTIAGRIWNEINYVNLVKNILPTRERARLILEKGQNHAVQHVRLRKL